MIIYGYAKEYKYANDGTLLIRVRIPSIHGPYSKSDYRGRTARNYVDDADLPYYASLILPHTPTDGEVVALTAVDSGNSSFIVIGLTGGSYSAGVTNLGE